MDAEIRTRLPAMVLAAASAGNGGFQNMRLVKKFGSAVVGTTFTPIAQGGVWRTPQASGASALRIKSGGNVDDAAGGSGAREVTIEGIDANGSLVSDTLSLAGASASAATSVAFMRVNRAYVSASGSYATQSAGSHAGDIVAENAAGSEDWFTIRFDGVANGQSEIGAYTIASGERAFVIGATVQVSSSKVVTAAFHVRENILEAEAPYSPMRVKQVYDGLTQGSYSLIQPDAPLMVPPLSDTGFMARVDTGTASVSVQYDILLVSDR